MTRERTSQDGRNQSQPSPKIVANRANSKFSTGPRTKQGKKTAARNALKHGLSIPVVADPCHSAEVEQTARLIAGDDCPPTLLLLARGIAEALVDLVRIRAVRFCLLGLGSNQNNTEQGKQPAAPLYAEGRFAAVAADHARDLSHLDRYEARAISRRKKAIRAFDSARLALN